MKIIAIGKNYADHVKEMNSALPENPVIFLKPDTAILKNNQPFYYPDFSENIHYECEVVLKICKNGKHIQEKFAHTYYDQVTLGIDFTARDLQKKCKDKGLPWEVSKAFDNSALIGDFVPADEIKSIQNTHFSLKKNNEVVQDGNTSDMIFPIEKLISYISQFFTLRIGDLIFTGTPDGVGPVQKGDKLEGFLEGKFLLGTEVK